MTPVNICLESSNLFWRLICISGYTRLWFLIRTSISGYIRLWFPIRTSISGLGLYINNLLCVVYMPFCIFPQHNKIVLLLSVNVANTSLVNHVNLCSFLH